jgi:hypothetical protein
MITNLATSKKQAFKEAFGNLSHRINSLALALSVYFPGNLNCRIFQLHADSKLEKAERVTKARATHSKGLCKIRDRFPIHHHLHLNQE